MLYKRGSFLSCGKQVIFDPLSSIISYSTIEIGHDTYIGPNAYLSTTHSKIIIGNYVMFGPNVHIYGGNHIFDKVGIPMSMIKKSAETKDEDVIIQDEVWIGGGAIILTGVTIGRGAIIGAGTVITKDIEPYSVAVGNPFKIIKKRFTPQQIAEHERMLDE